MSTSKHDTARRPSDFHGYSAEYASSHPLLDSFLKWFKKTSTECIPNATINELAKTTHHRLFYFFWIVGVGIMVSSFFYFFITGVNTARSSYFVSLQSSAGDCNEISRAFSATLRASHEGVWDGFQGFKLVDSPYIFTFNSFNGLDFPFYIDTISAVIHGIGEKAKTQPLYQNLIVWTSYTNFFETVRPDKSTYTTLEFSGYVDTIFNKQYMDWGIGNANATCTTAQTEFQSSATVYLEQTWDIGSTWEAGNCNEVIDPFDYGYDDKYGTKFSMKLDLYALTTALAINLNLIDTPNLERISRYSEFDLIAYIDPRYPGMAPIVCSYDIETGESPNGFNYCYIVINDNLCIPSIVPYYRECLECGNDDSNCNIFDLMPSCLFDPSSTKIFDPSFLDDQKTLHADIQQIAYDTVLNIYDEAHWEFCPSCWIYTVNTYDDFNEVNGNYFVVKNGHCSDSYSIPEENWESLKSVPPVQLKEIYFECIENYQTIFLSQFGIAIANSASMGEFALAVFVSAVFYCLSYYWKEALPEELRMHVHTSGGIPEDSHKGPTVGVSLNPLQKSTSA